MKSVTTQIDPREVEEIESRWGSGYRGTEKAIKAYNRLSRISLENIKGVFSREELYALIDCQQGVIFDPTWASQKKALIFSLEDAEKYDNLSGRWNIDFSKLIETINQLTVSQLYFLQEEIDRFWNHKEAYGAPSPDTEIFIDKFAK